MLQFSIFFYELTIFSTFLKKSDRKEESSGSRNDVWVFSKIVSFSSRRLQKFSVKRILYMFFVIVHTLYIFRNQNVNRLPLHYLPEFWILCEFRFWSEEYFDHFWFDEPLWEVKNCPLPQVKYLVRRHVESYSLWIVQNKILDTYLCTSGIERY